MFGKLLLFGFLGAILGILLKLINDLDVNKSVYRHEPGKCRLVDGVTRGSEDIALLSNGIAVVTSGPRLMFGELSGSGNLFMIDISENSNAGISDTPTAVKLKIVGHPDLSSFYPLGIAAWESKDRKEILLYVINSLKYVVEVFKFDSDAATAQYKKTIRDPHFRSLNNLAMTGRDSFYVSNWLHYTEPKLMVAEVALKLPFGSVVYYDGKTGRNVLTGVKGPNGIALSKGLETLFLSVNAGKEFRAYQILDDNNLNITTTLPLTVLPDNLFLDQDDYLWTGSHPVAWKIGSHIYDPKVYDAPSQVLKAHYNYKTKEFGPVAEVYADDGAILQGATVAVRNNNKLLIGTLIHKLMLCTLNTTAA